MLTSKMLRMLAQNSSIPLLRLRQTGPAIKHNQQDIPLNLVPLLFILTPQQPQPPPSSRVPSLLSLHDQLAASPDRLHALHFRPELRAALPLRWTRPRLCGRKICWSHYDVCRLWWCLVRRFQPRSDDRKRGIGGLRRLTCGWKLAGEEGRLMRI